MITASVMKETNQILEALEKLLTTTCTCAKGSIAILIKHFLIFISASLRRLEENVTTLLKTSHKKREFLLLVSRNENLFLVTMLKMIIFNYKIKRY